MKLFRIYRVQCLTHENKRIVLNVNKIDDDYSINDQFLYETSDISSFRKQLKEEMNGKKILLSYYEIPAKNK